MDILIVVLGLGLLFAGGEGLVRGAIALAARFGLSPLLIGLTVVGFGTSMPELLVSVDAALRGVPDIAMGNVVGSNIANILLIVGVSALVFPIALSARDLRRDLLVMLAATLLIWGFAAFGTVPRWGGGLLLLALLAYLIHAARDDRGTDPDAVATPGLSVLAAAAWLVFGLAALMLGARLLVDGAVAIARDLGLSEAFIGLTIVAIGTSLPELATSVTAALRRQSAIAIGNVIGSNFFNAFGILGATALISPLTIAPRFATLDVPLALAAAVLLSVLLWRGGVGRWSALGCLAGYAAYLTLTA